MGQTLFKRIRRLVHNATGTPLPKIKPDSSLFLDLGMDLEAAAGFFAHFAAEFEIDVSEMTLASHFQPHGHAVHDGVAGLVYAAFVASERHRLAGVKPLLVSDLMTMAKSKRWTL